jgi:hypothetical protein
MGIYSPEDGIPHNHRRENLKSYITLTGWICGFYVASYD